MNTNEFRKPLLQSTALIIIFLFFFAFVVSSGADNLRSGLLAILSGTFHAILLFFSLIFSILISISLLVLVFLAAMALYSIDKAKETWTNLLSAISNLYEQIKDTLLRIKLGNQCRTDSLSSKIHKLEHELAQLSEENQQLRRTIEHLTQQVSEKSSPLKLDH